LGIVKKISPFKISRDAESCISCSSCNTDCPAGLDVENAQDIKSADCVSCLNCVEVCPKGSLSAKIFKYKIPKKYYNIIVVGLFFSLLFILTLTPIWQTRPTTNVLDSSGNINVDNIRGSNTLGHIIKKTGIEYEVFRKELGLPSKINFNIKLKEIGPTYNILDSNGDYIHTEVFREIIRKAQEPNKPDCPFGEVKDEFPGKCGLYIDKDKNHICDLSE